MAAGSTLTIDKDKNEASSNNRIVDFCVYVFNNPYYQGEAGKVMLAIVYKTDSNEAPMAILKKVLGDL